jgi:N-sulfoglucosamine sulfohydrolase
MKKEKLNIVLIVSDDHGREALGCYGNKKIRTPNLDMLAEDGVRFTNAFCTAASCAASRAVILTGVQNHTNGTYGHTHGRNHFSCFDNVVTLPKLLNDAGYRTACIGKKHYAPVSLFPFMEDLDADFQKDSAERDDVKMAGNCSKFISDGDKRPFFLYFCSHNPHRDDRDGRLLEQHPCKPNRFGNPDQAFPNDVEISYSDDEVEVPSFLPDSPESRAEIAQYYQSISRLDRGIGRLTGILKETGKYENTLIIYISDNGSAFPASKTTLYDPGMNLPCIVKSPIHKNKGKACDALVTWADLTPTILDFAGAKTEPSKFFGKSFKRVIDRESPLDWRDEIYASHTFHEITNYYPMRVVRSKKFKFIWNIASPLTYPSASDIWASPTWQAELRKKSEMFGNRKMDAYLHRPRFELYDLENDPHELVNLSEKEEFKDIVNGFCEKLKKFQKDTADQWLHKWVYE